MLRIEIWERGKFRPTAPPFEGTGLPSGFLTDTDRFVIEGAQLGIPVALVDPSSGSGGTAADLNFLTEITHATVLGFSGLHSYSFSVQDVLSPGTEQPEPRFAIIGTTEVEGTLLVGESDLLNASNPVTELQGRAKALNSLREVCERCVEAGWDGYDASPITQAACREAERFIRLLPPSIPVPDILPEPTGEIVFEWYRDPYHVFAASVGGQHVVTYSGLFGQATRVHGTEYFEESLPLTVIRQIMRLFR